MVIFENFLEFTYVLNPGAAFGFLSDVSENIRHPLFITVTSLALAFFVYVYFTLDEGYQLTRISLLLIISGATGNFIDRLRIKAVVDFVYFHYYNHYWPAFNVADSLITIGVCLIAYDILINHKNEKAEPECAQ